MKKSLGERIEELRADRTQKEFAAFIGVPLNTYTNWVRGIRNPASDALVTICTRLGVSSDWLLGLSGDTGTQRSGTLRPVAASAVGEKPLYDRAVGSHPNPDAYWRDLVASQQATIATLAGLLAAGRSSVADPAATGGRAATKPA